MDIPQNVSTYIPARCGFCAVRILEREITQALHARSPREENRMRHTSHVDLAQASSASIWRWISVATVALGDGDVQRKSRFAASKTGMSGSKL